MNTDKNEKKNQIFLICQSREFLVIKIEKEKKSKFSYKKSIAKSEKKIRFFSQKNILLLGLPGD